MCLSDKLFASDVKFRNKLVEEYLCLNFMYSPPQTGLTFVELFEL